MKVAFLRIIIVSAVSALGVVLLSTWFERRGFSGALLEITFFILLAVFVSLVSFDRGLGASRAVRKLVFAGAAGHLAALGAYLAYSAVKDMNLRPFNGSTSFEVVQHYLWMGIAVPCLLGGAMLGMAAILPVLIYDHSGGRMVRSASEL